MKKLPFVALMLLLAGIAGSSFSETVPEKEKIQSAKGEFEIKLAPQADDIAPVGRIIIDKLYQGDMEGSGVGQMISKRIEGGAAIYYAIEEFTGSVQGKTGAFTLVHQGYMNKESLSLQIEILEGSGSGDLENISGSMVIVQDANGHRYELKYEL